MFHVCVNLGEEFGNTDEDKIEHVCWYEFKFAVHSNDMLVDYLFECRQN